MSAGKADTSDQRAQFAAREFVARWVRETGTALSAVATDRMLFAYEMGFLRGQTESARDMTERLTAQVQDQASCQKEGDDDGE